METTEPVLTSKNVILKNLYRNGNKVPMMFRNGELIYHMIEITPKEQKVLPNRSYVFNFNAKNYDANTYTIPNENGATLQENMVWSATTSSVRNNISFNLDHITIPASAFSAFIYSTTGANPMNITDAAPSMTMIIKARTTAGTNSYGQSQPITGTNSYNLFSNRSNTDGFHLMFRSNNKAWIICGGAGYDASPNSVPVATATTVTLLLRINNKQVEIKNLTTGVSNTPFTPTFNNPTRIFSFFSSFFASGNGLAETTSGDFYWCYASREVLTDAEVQQVVDFNEN